MTIRQKHLVFILVSFLITSTLFISANSFQKNHHNEVTMRLVGHNILLLSGDSSSLILPIEHNNNQYTIRFQKNFGFYPDELIYTIDSLFEKAGLTNHYIVEVNNCKTNTTAYSYEMSADQKANLIPCKGRPQPEACYYIVIALLEPTVAHILKPEYLQTDIHKEEPKINYLMVILLVFLTLLTSFFVLQVKKRQKGFAKKNALKIGLFEFNPNQMTLVIQKQTIELSGKESELLALLYQNKNETVDKNTLLKEVWGDEGDYIGRTLDVFISKLRKKLHADESVKIANIRGVGYKLIVNG